MGYLTHIASTNCGQYGWYSDKLSYRYTTHDPQTQKNWPAMPGAFKSLAYDAAEKAGFKNFESNACLINHYGIGTNLGAHQDKNEKDFSQPIVTVSIGLPAVFQIYGNSRSNKVLNHTVYDGDVMVWGNSARLMYHGVRRIKADPQNPNLDYRISLTFRNAG